MKRFKCTVERTDEYIIKFDETKFNEKWMEEFRKYFYDFYDLSEHAEHIALCRARFPEDSFIEGYGVPLVDGRKPIFRKDDEVEKGINIIVLSENSDEYVDVEEIE